MATEPHRHRAGVRTGVLFERHGRMVLGLCRVLLRDAEEAEDAAQQTFLDAHRAMLGGTVVHDDAAWLAAIARNECRARIVARTRAPLAISHDELVEAAGAAGQEAPEAPSDELRHALAELPEQQREAVVLRDVYGLRYREVAVALGLSRPAVESVLFRARRRLRTRLRPVAGALVVPSGLRDALDQALPGFAAGEGSATVAGAAGATGVLVKLGTGSFAAKLAAGTVVVGAGGGSLAVGLDVGEREQLSGGAAAAVKLPAAGSREHIVRRSGPPGAPTDRHGGRDAPARGDSTGPGRLGAHNQQRGVGEDSSGPGGGRHDDGERSDDSRGGHGDTEFESGPPGSGPGPSPSETELDDERDTSAQEDHSSRSGDTSGSRGSGSGTRSSHGGQSGPGSNGSPGATPPGSGADGSAASNRDSSSSGPGSGSSAPEPSSSGPVAAGQAVVIEDPSSSGSGASGSGSSGSGSGPGLDSSGAQSGNED